MDTTYIPDHTYLSPFPPNYLSIGQSVYLSLYQSVCLSTHLTTCLDTPYCLHKDLCTSTKRDICFEMQHPSCKMWILLGMLGRLLDPSITLSLAISRSPSSLTASSTSTIVRNQEVWNRSQWQIYIYIYIRWDHLLPGKLEWRSPGPFELASWATVTASSSKRCSTYCKVKSTIQFQEAKVSKISWLLNKWGY